MNTHRKPPANDPAAARLLEDSLARVREALSRLQYGTVSLTIHEGRVVQLDVTERQRLSAN